MSRSYAKFWRDLDMAGLTRNHKACALYCHILCTASVTARRVLFNGTAVDIQPGQVVTSRSELSAFLGLTDKEIRGAIKALEKLELIAVKGANKYTLITLKNSDACDNAGPTEGQQVGQEGTKSGPTGGPSEGQPFYKDIECRKKNEECNSLRGKNFSSHAPMNAEDIEEAKSGIRREAEAVRQEFDELREAYKAVRDDGPMAGWPEYQQARRSKGWPGLLFVLDRLQTLIEQDDQWKRGYKEGLRRFLTDRMWEIEPRKAAPAPNAEPEKTAEDRALDEKIAKMRAEMKAKEAARKKAARGW